MRALLLAILLLVLPPSAAASAQGLLWPNDPILRDCRWPNIGYPRDCYHPQYNPYSSVIERQMYADYLQVQCWYRYGSVC